MTLISSEQGKNIKKYVLHIFLLTGVYLLLATIGMSLALHRISPVWPPSGIAIGALLIGGYSIWPGIWLGSFLANFLYSVGTDNLSFLMLTQMAVGAVLEAVVGAYFFKKYIPNFITLPKPKDVALFVLLIVFLSSFISAVNGSLILSYHYDDWALFGNTLITWWLGDAMGVIVFTPLVLAFYQAFPIKYKLRNYLEASLLIITIFLIGTISYLSNYPVEHFYIPCIIWAVFRFRIIGTVTFTLLISIIAILSTIHGYGNFFLETRNESLLLLQSFIGIIAITGLTLNSLLSERDQRENSLKKVSEEALEARLEAEQANKAKSIFLANMSHELRTPLNHIIGYSEILTDEATIESTPQFSKYLNNIIASSYRLLKMISDILEISKLEAGKTRAEIGDVDLVSMIEKYPQKLEEELSKHQNKLEIYSDPVGTISGDASKINFILDSLLSNACKFTTKGTIILRIKREIVDNLDLLVITVSDTGIGITEDQMKNLFKPFVKIENVNYGGLGLGLLISKRFCELMGGKITVESKAQEGTTFTVTIPANLRK